MPLRSLTLFVVLLVAGCAAGPATLEPTKPVAAEAPRTVYVIGPGDHLQVSVYGQPELSKEYAVTAEGELSMPLAGQIHAAGLSVVQLEDTLRARLAEYIKNPQVTVAVQQGQQRFSVLGQVQRPGTYVLDKRTTVLQAVSIAGGLTEKAAPNRTRVIRSGGGREVAIDVPLGDLMDGSEQTHDIILQPDDKVVVPESFF
jgi:polysaccharide biosynthesis/export protein